MMNKSVQFLDYQVHEEIKSQSRRDFGEGSGNVLLLEADGFLRQAVDNFALAKANLSEAEEELKRILEKLVKHENPPEQASGPVPVKDSSTDGI